jgi:hypothetical protein
MGKIKFSDDEEKDNDAIREYLAGGENSLNTFDGRVIGNAYDKLSVIMRIL